MVMTNTQLKDPTTKFETPIIGLMIRTDGMVENLKVTCDAGFMDVYELAFGNDTIDVLPVHPKTETTIIIGDHSRVNGSPMNMTASLWLAATHRYGSVVSGNVVVFGCNENGDEKSVPVQVFDEIPDFNQANSVTKFLDPIGAFLRAKQAGESGG